MNFMYYDVKNKIGYEFRNVGLLEQAFVKNPDLTIQQLINGKLSIVKFDRFVLGEGLEKRQDNFAEEVMSQIKG